MTVVKTIPIERPAEATCRGVGMPPVFDSFLVHDSIAPEGDPTGALRVRPDLSRVAVPLATAMGSCLLEAFLAGRRAERARFEAASASGVVAAIGWRH